MQKFCTYRMSRYGDQTNCENLDCVGQLEIGQVGYLLNHPHIHTYKEDGNKIFLDDYEL